MKQQFVIKHQYTVLEQTEQLDQSLMDQQLSMLCFFENVRTCNIFVDTTFWLNVFFDPTV
jgi:hypothetical protein